MNKIITIFILILLTSNIVSSHSGRTDKSGGHYNRSTGNYHSHSSSGGSIAIVFIIIGGIVVYGLFRPRTLKPKKNKVTITENKKSIKNNITLVKQKTESGCVTIIALIMMIVGGLTVLNQLFGSSKLDGFVLTMSLLVVFFGYFAFVGTMDD